jgi:FHS family L-fucose permease-like MFS transporter
MREKLTDLNFTIRDILLQMKLSLDLIYKTQTNLMDQHKFTTRENLIPFILVTALFLFWGIASNLNDILIKQFMKSFDITRFKASLVQSAFYMGYFLLAIPAAMIMRKYSYKAGLVIGLLLYSIGTFLFYPAALSGKFIYFLMDLFVIASGLSFLETGANPFIARLGDPASAERRLNFSQAFNSLGAVTGVGLGTLFILSGIELKADQVAAMKLNGSYSQYLQHETMRVVPLYLILGGIIFIWALMIWRTKFPEVTEEKIPGAPEGKGYFRDLLKYPHFIKGVIAQFFYVGAQVGTWSWYIQYIQDYTHQPEKVAGGLLVGSLVAFGVGRFSSAWIMKYFNPSRLMGVYAFANIFLLTIAIILPGWVGLWAVFCTSFFMSVMFPTIFALSIRGLGVNTKIGSSFLVMAIIGGAVFTPIMGLIFMVKKSMALAMIVPLVCYVFISYYAFIGSKAKAIQTV